MVGAGLAAPHSVFNVEIGPHRRFAMTQADLDDLKRVKDAHGGTVNDVILSIVAGGSAATCAPAATRPRGSSCGRWCRSASAPTDERGALGNRITAMMAPLPVWWRTRSSGCT